MEDAGVLVATDDIDPFYWAKIAYGGYIKQSGGISLISGDRLPEFDALKQSIKEAWEAAANAVIAEWDDMMK